MILGQLQISVTGWRFEPQPSKLSQLTLAPCRQVLLFYTHANGNLILDTIVRWTWQRESFQVNRNVGIALNCVQSSNCVLLGNFSRYCRCEMTFFSHLVKYCVHNGTIVRRCLLGVKYYATQQEILFSCRERSHSGAFLRQVAYIMIMSGCG